MPAACARAALTPSRLAPRVSRAAPPSHQDYNGQKNFGTKGSVLDDLRGNDDFCMYDLEPPVAEHLKVAVGRRAGFYKDKVKVMVEGKDEKGRVFIVTAFIDAEGKLTDDYFKSIDERLVTF